MTNYIHTILFLSVTAFIFDNILSSFDSYKRLSGAFKFIYSLCVFFAIIFPLLSLKFDFSKFNNSINQPKNNTENSIYAFETLLKNELEEKIANEIFKNFGISPKSISIDLSTKTNTTQSNVTIQKIFITIKENEKAFSDKIADHICALMEIDRNNVITLTQG